MNSSDWELMSGTITSTDRPVNSTEPVDLPDEVAHAWVAVVIDIYEKRYPPADAESNFDTSSSGRYNITH